MAAKKLSMSAKIFVPAISINALAATAIFAVHGKCAGSGVKDFPF